MPKTATPKFVCYYNSLRTDDSVGIEREENAWEGSLPEVRLCEEILGGETLDEVRQRFNEYFALPRTIDFHRGLQYHMPEGKSETEVLYSQGGGCGVWSMYDIRELVEGDPVPPHEKILEDI